MIPVYQTRVGQGGNCSQAAIASILELPLGEVPDFHSDKFRSQDEKIADFVRPLGYEYVVTAAAEVRDVPDVYHTISGRSPRGIQHCTVGRGGKIVHDPHPEGGGVKITSFGFFVPLENQTVQDKIGGMRLTVGHLEPNGDVVIDETGFLPLLLMLIKPTVKAVAKAKKRDKLGKQVTKLGVSAAKGAAKGSEKGAKDAEKTSK